MKLARIPFGIVVGISLLMSSATIPSPEANTLVVGEVFPEMNVEVGVHRQLAPKVEAGKYVLVHFWGAYDAASRASNVQWSKFFGSLPQQSRISYYPICLDPDQDVYRQTINLDGISPKQQIFAGGLARSSVLTTYKLEDGLSTFLIDDQGIIRAINPTSVELEQSYLL